MSRETFIEKSPDDLDLEIYSEHAQKFIRKIFPKIQSYYQERGKYHQTINICGIRQM